MKQALGKKHPYRIDIIILWMAAFGMLLYSYTLPFMQTEKFFFFSDEYSLVASIQGLWKAGYKFLAVIIFSFSIIFPIVKLFMVFVLWVSPFTDTQREKMGFWLGVLGRWSMLDVFVVAILVVLIRAQALMNAQPRNGVYVFAIAIALSLVLSIHKHTRLERTCPNLSHCVSPKMNSNCSRSLRSCVTTKFLVLPKGSIFKTCLVLGSPVRDTISSPDL